MREYRQLTEDRIKDLQIKKDDTFEDGHLSMCYYRCYLRKSSRAEMGEGGRRQGGTCMKLGVFTDLYQNLPFEAMLDKLAAMGVKVVELRTGNYPVNHH